MRKGLSHSHARRLLREGRIPGAMKVGRDWIVNLGLTAIQGEGVETAKVLAERLGFSHSHTRRLLRYHRIKGEKIGRDWIIASRKHIGYLRQRAKPGNSGSTLRKIQTSGRGRQVRRGIFLKLNRPAVSAGYDLFL
jgi:hypothetical protein